jgi:hypothetical protein
VFTLSYVNTALSQSGFRIYKCYIIIKITDFVKKICNNKGENIQIDETKRSAIMSVHAE